MAQLKIREMPKDDRPREKLAARGAIALNDAELIAILLRTGVEGANAIEVARQLIEKYGSLGTLSRCTVKELAKIKGVGFREGGATGGGLRSWPATRARNFARRENREHRNRFTNCSDPRCAPCTRNRSASSCSIRVTISSGCEDVSLGSVNESIAHPRDVFRPALIYSAYAVVVVHNHPSGDPSPSQADHGLTRRLREAAELLQIKLLDHVIIGAPGEGRLPYFSFKEVGVL